MKTNLECYPCFVQQALDASRIAGLGSQLRYELVQRVLRLMAGFDPQQPPVKMGQATHRLVRELTGHADPYAELKRRSNELALRLFPAARELVLRATDPLETAIRLSIAGNIIDFGAQQLRDVPDLQATMDECLEATFGRESLAQLRAALAGAQSVLVVGDNAGECVLDALLLEQLAPRKLVYTVRNSPVLNDALEEDARIAGLDRFARIISCGTDAPGALLEDCSQEFLDELERADVVLSKGQGNFECLSNAGRPIFFLLKVKCSGVAEELGVPLGSMVAAQGGMGPLAPLQDIATDTELTSCSS